MLFRFSFFKRHVPHVLDVSFLQPKKKQDVDQNFPLAAVCMNITKMVMEQIDASNDLLKLRADVQLSCPMVSM